MNEQLKSATSCVRWAKAQRAVPPSVNIDGLFNGGHASLCLSYGARSCLKPAARKNEFRQPFQRDLGRPDYAAKINRFSFRPNQLHLRAIPPHRRGAYASSRYVECGLRWTRGRSRARGIAGRPQALSWGCERLIRAGRAAFSRTAKACGSGTRGWCQAGGGCSNPTGFDQPSIRQRRRQKEFVSGESAP